MATAANGNNGQTVGSTDEVLFQATNDSGSQINNAKAISIYNGDSAETLLVRPDWYSASEYIPIPAGKSLTFENDEPGAAIMRITAKRGGSSDVTSVGWGVTKVGFGESLRS